MENNSLNGKQNEMNGTAGGEEITGMNGTAEMNDTVITGDPADAGDTAESSCPADESGLTESSGLTETPETDASEKAEKTKTTGNSSWQKPVLLTAAAAAAVFIAFEVGEEVTERRLASRMNAPQQTEANDAVASGQTKTVVPPPAPMFAQGQNVSLISEDTAKEIALESVGLTAGSVNMLFAHLERDDGFYQYDVKFVYDTFEYDFEIDAVNGVIMESDIDSVYD